MSRHPVIPIAVAGAAAAAAPGAAPGAAPADSQGAASGLRKRQAPKGRGVDAQALAEVQALLGDASRQPDWLIEHLHAIQDHYGYLSAAHLVALAHEMGLPQTAVYEVASFYHHFDVVREGESAPPALTVRVCNSLSCEITGSDDLLQRLPALLGGEVRVIPAPCMGCCDQAPVAMVGQHLMQEASVESVYEAVTNGPEPKSVDEDFIDLDVYLWDYGYQMLQACHSGQRSVDEVIHALEDAGLRGLGGAGFPAWRKWRAVRAQPGPRLLVVNIDEGEPGTFKDRYYLESDPHRCMEGMLIAAWAVGAEKIYIYLRDEYHDCRAMLQTELARLRAQPPLQGLPPIELRRGAGAYICGEESALIESIEGKRGMPRLRPPLVSQTGLFGRPTLVHNLETLYWVRAILERGGAWFSSFGYNKRQGLRTFSVSGRVREPGIKVAPAGITMEELLDTYCHGMQSGHRFYAYLPGGASGGILPARLAHIPLDFDTLQPYGCFIGSAAVIVLSEHDSAVQAARNLMRFFAHESCGQCTPCRVGTAKAVGLMDAPEWNLPLLAELSQAMRDASICGLGQAAPNLVDCVVKYFAHELEPIPGSSPAPGNRSRVF